MHFILHVKDVSMDKEYSLQQCTMSFLKFLTEESLHSFIIFIFPLSFNY